MDMDTQRGHECPSWKWTCNKRHGHATRPWTCSSDMRTGHYASAEHAGLTWTWTCSMEMDMLHGQGHTAGTRGHGYRNRHYGPTNTYLHINHPPPLSPTVTAAIPLISRLGNPLLHTKIKLIQA